MRGGGGRCKCLCYLLVYVSRAVCVSAHEERAPIRPIVAQEFQYCYALFELYPGGICVYV